MSWSTQFTQGASGKAKSVRVSLRGQRREKLGRKSVYTPKLIEVVYHAILASRLLIYVVLQ